MSMKWFFYYANVTCLSQTLSDEQNWWNLEVAFATNNKKFTALNVWQLQNYHSAITIEI